MLTQCPEVNELIILQVCLNIYIKLCRIKSIWGLNVDKNYYNYKTYLIIQSCYKYLTFSYVAGSQDYDCYIIILLIYVC